MDPDARRRIPLTFDEMETPRERIPLIEGNRMRCPRCRRLFNILQFVRLIQIEEFVEDTAPVYKCPRRETSADGEHRGCGFLFAPSGRAYHDFLGVEDQEATQTA